MLKRWKIDLRVLLSFVAKEFPPESLSKPTVLAVGYMVGDASGTGLGSFLFVSDSPTITIIEGKWSATIREDSSSNFRELANLVFSLNIF